MEYSEYTIYDMTEYDTFLQSIGVDKSQFIEHLNIVTNPNSQLCDFNAMLSYISDIDEYSFKYIVSSLNSDPIFYRIWYIYFKFLLLDDEIKDNFYKNYIHKLISVNNLLHLGNTRNKENWNIILKVIYELVNVNEPLQIFMDCNDNYGQYKRLDISKKHNIVYKKNKYIDNFILDAFQDVVENFDLVHFCHNIIYCISDKYGYIKIENSNGFVDFEQRFHSNIDNFIIAWNAITITYFEICGKDITIQDKAIQKIPIDKMGCCNKFGYYDGRKIVDINIEDRYMVMTYLFEEIFLISHTSFNKRFDDQFRFYLERVLKYDIQEDRYKLYYYRFNNCHTEQKIEFKLEERYTNYVQSNLVKGLDYIYCHIYSKLININLDENLIELKIYIKKILDEFNYEKLIRF